jgi:hypothetical protein
MKSMFIALIMVAIQSATTLSPRQIATLDRPLESAEVEAVLAASREAIADKTLTLSYPGRQDGLQMLMRRDGWPRIVRAEFELEGGTIDGTPAGAVVSERWRDRFVAIVEYTGTAARRCDGATLPGELVITYEHRQSTDVWTTDAGTHGRRAGVPIANPIFDVLSGKVPAVSGKKTVIDGRVVREFTAPFSAPSNTYGLGDPPAQATQTLWIEVDSLLPVRWDVTAESRITDTRVLNYSAFELRQPVGVEPPQCIP